MFYVDHELHKLSSVLPNAINYFIFKNFARIIIYLAETTFENKRSWN